MKIESKNIVGTEYGQKSVISGMKQIAGRAGRFKSKYSTGLINCFDEKLLEKVRNILEKPVEPIQKAMLFPNYEHLDSLSLLMQTNKISRVMKVLIDNAKYNEGLYN
ncbi:MAG: hypothetical protein MHPSP_004755, partial [Paramarteilia canceri]